MPFPDIPLSIIYTDRVRVRSVSWTKDEVGARKANYSGGWSGEFPCSVSAAGAQDVELHSRESMIVTHVVTASTRLGTIRDQLQWDETGAILTIVGVEPAGDNTGRIFNHFCEEHPST